MTLRHHLTWRGVKYSLPKQKILVGTTEVCGTLTTFTDGFRRLGYPVNSVIRGRDLYDDPEVQYDIDLNSAVINWPGRISCSKSLLVRLPRGAINRLVQRARMLRMMNHDIFVFQHAQSLAGVNSDYPALKKKRKANLFHFQWRLHSPWFGVRPTICQCRGARVFVGKTDVAGRPAPRPHFRDSRAAA